MSAEFHNFIFPRGDILSFLDYFSETFLLSFQLSRTQFSSYQLLNLLTFIDCIAQIRFSINVSWDQKLAAIARSHKRQNKSLLYLGIGLGHASKLHMRQNC